MATWAGTSSALPFLAQAYEGIGKQQFIAVPAPRILIVVLNIVDYNAICGSYVGVVSPAFTSYDEYKRSALGTGRKLGSGAARAADVLPQLI